MGCGAEPHVPSGVKQIGTLANLAITESSGVVASRQYTNVFWTHNDGGKSETLFAVTREGKSLSEFKVLGAKIDDWEDIAIDNERHLYIADTGDNNSKRKHVAVYRVDEPDPASSGVVQTTRKWKLHWPSGPVDSEALFVYGTNGYLVTKVKNDRRAEVYRFHLSDVELQTLEPFARLTIDSPVTAADISANGAAVAIVAGTGVFLYRIDGDIGKLGQMRPSYFKRFRHDSMEACTFVPEGLLTTAESKQIYLFTDEPFRVLR